jgi:hypothetical protein
VERRSRHRLDRAAGGQVRVHEHAEVAALAPMNRWWKFLLLVAIVLAIALCFGPGLSG